MQPQCPKCQQKIGKTGWRVECYECKKWFHFKCTNLKKEDVQGQKNKNFKWICGTCERSQSLESSEFSSSEDSDIIVMPEDRRSSLFYKSKKSLNRQSTNANENSKKAPRTKEMLLHITKKIEEIEASLQYNNKLVEDLRTTVKDLSTENRKLRKEQERLSDRVIQLETEIIQVQNKRLDEDRQQNLIIMGLSKEDKTIKKDFQALIKALNVQVNEDQVLIRMLPSEKPIKPIMVKFRSKEIRDKVLQKRKDLRDKDSNQLGLDGETRNIFINEDLSKETKLLFNKARELKKVGYKYVWCRDGSVFCRVADGSAKVRLKLITQVEKLIENRVKGG